MKKNRGKNIIPRIHNDKISTHSYRNEVIRTGSYTHRAGEKVGKGQGREVTSGGKRGKGWR